MPAARGWRADHSASRRHGRHAAAALRMNIHTYNKRLCTTVRTPSRSGCIGAAVRPVVTWRIVLALLLKSELSKSAYGMLSVCGAAQDDPRGRHAAGMLALVVFLNLLCGLQLGALPFNIFLCCSATANLLNFFRSVGVSVKLSNHLASGTDLCATGMDCNKAAVAVCFRG